MTTKFVNIIEENSTLKIALCKENEELSLVDRNVLGVESFALSSQNNGKRFICTAVNAKYDKLDDYSWYELTQIPELVSGDGAALCEALGLLWTFMPNAIDSDVKLPDYIYKLKDEKDITFFGGSFDPWHVGHSECVDQCPNQNLIVVPDANPWKGLESYGCPFKSYMAIVMTLRETTHSVFSGFWGMKTANPTVSWIGQVKADMKSLLIGDDNFMSFLKWQDVESLVNRIDTIFVVPRLHKITELQSVKEEILKINPHIEIQFLNEHAYQDISSSEIRKLKDNLGF